MGWMYILPRAYKITSFWKKTTTTTKTTKNQEQKTKQENNIQRTKENYWQFYHSHTFLHVTIFFHNARWEKANSKPIF